MKLFKVAESNLDELSYVNYINMLLNRFLVISNNYRDYSFTFDIYYSVLYTNPLWFLI